jgi:hypothetical protein
MIDRIANAVAFLASDDARLIGAPRNGPQRKVN